ncbi:MAG: M24 family metallopeptidase [Collinsella sp.]
MLGFIKPGMTEKQVRNELENFMFANGADSLAFGSIVASGPNTANPHAVPSDRVIEKGDFVLMDYGAGYCDYRSDMTRTVVMGESPRRSSSTCTRSMRRAHEVRRRHPSGVEATTFSNFQEDHWRCRLWRLHTMVWARRGVDIHELPKLQPQQEYHRGRLGYHHEPGVHLPGVRGGVRLEDTAWSPRTATTLHQTPA